MVISPFTLDRTDVILKHDLSRSSYFSLTNYIINSRMFLLSLTSIFIMVFYLHNNNLINKSKFPLVSKYE